MKLIKIALIEEKKSKFYGYLYEVDNKEEISSILENIKRENKGYRHLPYAYKINNTASKTNDKEPGNIGLSFLNILERNNLNNHLLIVVRYYGGTKLGAALLARTYSKCANLCINSK
jgi:putative IMPACT (imprinted ancient) family translation regulator